MGLYRAPKVSKECTAFAIPGRQSKPPYSPINKQGTLASRVDIPTKYAVGQSFAKGKES